jgi:hypothetical protein
LSQAIGVAHNGPFAGSGVENLHRHLTKVAKAEAERDSARSGLLA